MSTEQYDVSEIVVVSGHTRTSFYEDYADALRFAVGLVRDGILALEIQQVGCLHTFEEIEAASDALEENYTDEELIEEVHYASRVRAGRG